MVNNRFCLHIKESYNENIRAKIPQIFEKINPGPTRDQNFYNSLSYCRYHKINYFLSHNCLLSHSFIFEPNLKMLLWIKMHKNIIPYDTDEENKFHKPGPN